MSTTEPTPATQAPARRSRAPLILLGVALLAGAGVAVHHYTVGRYQATWCG
jgi:hypothetical protein